MKKFSVLLLAGFFWLTSFGLVLADDTRVPDDPVWDIAETTTNPSFTFRGSVIDYADELDTPGIVSVVEFAVGNDDFSACTIDMGELGIDSYVEFTCNATFVTTGANDVFLRVVDSANNETVDNRSVNYLVDNPVTISLPAGAMTSQESNTIQGTANSTSGEVTEVEYRITGGEWNSCVGTTSFSCNVTIGDSLGVYPFEFRAGNGTTLSNTYYHELVRGSSDLVFFTPNNDATNFTDLKSGLSGTKLNGNISVVAGKEGAALDFNGGYGSFSDTGSTLTFAGSSGKFTVEAWVKSSDFSTMAYSRIISKYQNNNADHSWLMGVDNASGVYCAIITADIEQYLVETGNSGHKFINNQWNKVGCTYDGSTGVLKAMLNDEEVGQTTVPVEKRELVTSNGSVSFGASLDGGSPFVGQLDSVAIYNTVHSYGQPSDGDNEAPVVTLTSVDVGSTYKTLADEYQIVGTVTDNDKGVASVEYRLASGEWQECSLESGSFTCSIDNIVGDQSKLVEIRSTDLSTAQNVSETKGFYLIANATPVGGLLANFSMANENDSVGFLGKSSVLGTFNGGLFNGSTKVLYSDLNKNFDFAGDNGSFTVDVMVKPDSSWSNNAKVIVGKTKEDGNSSWELSISADLHVYAFFDTEDDLTVGQDQANTLVTAGEWSHVILSWDAATKSVSLKVNSNEAVIGSFALKNTLSESTKDLVVGGIKKNDEMRFTGELDDLKIYTSGDASAPYVEITPLADRERVTTKNPEFEITVTDQNKISEVEYLFANSPYNTNIDAENWQTINPVDESFDETTEEFVITASNLTDGTWYLFVRATDENGNKSLYVNDGWNTSYGVSSNSVMAVYRFVVEAEDATAPNLYAHTVVPNKTIDRSPSIRGYARDYRFINQGDTASNIKKIYYRINSGEWLEVSPMDGNFNSPSEEFNIVLNNLAPGNYSYEIKAEDEAGNDTGNSDDNLSGVFEIISPVSVPNVEAVSRDVNFSTRDLSDPIYTTAVWGNDMARLRQKIDFTSERVLYTNEDDFGYEYGGVSLGLEKSTDGNLWIINNSHRLAYYDLSVGSQTTYPYFKNDRTQTPTGVYEFEEDNHRYLVVSYEGTISSILCDINNTPKNISDDTCIDMNTYFVPTGTDDRLNRKGFYGLLGRTEENINNIFGYWDPKGTVMNLSDDEYLIWTRDQNLDLRDNLSDGAPATVDITNLFFDKANNRILINTYTNGTYVCTDGGNPLEKSGHQCWSHLAGVSKYAIYSVVKDDQNRYWMGGNKGLFMLDVKGTNDNADDERIQVIDKADIADEQIAKIEWLKGEYPVGDEIAYVTRSGHLRVIETNNTPSDSQDDTNYDYQMPFVLHRQGAAPAWVMTNRSTAYSVSQARGLYKIDLTRSFEDHNVVEFLPTPPSGMLEINNVTLTDVEGSVSVGSSHTFNDLVSYEVSNNDGLSWLSITEGQTVKFPTSGYKLKFRINLYKGSTPILDRVKLDYFAYPDEATRISVENSSSSSNSSPSVAVCEAKVPGTVPQITKIVPEGLGKVRIYFSESSGEYTNYALSYGFWSGDARFGSTNIGSRGATSYLVQHLLPFKKYYFKVRAVNGCNATNWSSEVASRGPITRNSQVLAQVENDEVNQLKETKRLVELYRLTRKLYF
ncbi:MAG TPA: LamG domain-containing protein [Candidatus Woesebacteria bacterium]|nr:LamG domain-containing protein [Candidatus Woesebacteria bacterium]